MKGFLIFLAVVAAVSAIPNLRCPRRQIFNWDIERLLPHEECNKYYQCTHGEPVERWCPRGLVFNTLRRICDWPANVKCRGRVIISEVPEYVEEQDEEDDDSESGIPILPEWIPTTPLVDADKIERLPNGCPVDFSINILVAHKWRCNRFYYCEEGERVAFRCPRGLHFNVQEQVCDYPHRAGCRKWF